MSEKATLLTSIPPVSKSEPVKKASLLTPINSQPSESDKILQSLEQSSKPKSILSDVKATKSDSGAQVKNLNISTPASRESSSNAVSEVAAAPVKPAAVVETVGGDSAGKEAASGGSGVVTVISIVLVLCLVGVAVFVFLRKSKGGAKTKSDSVSWEDRKKAKAASSAQPVAQPAAAPVATSQPAATPQPDPIIEFLNQEAEDAAEVVSAPAASIKAVQQVSAATPPPPKPRVNKPLPPRSSAPKKPNPVKAAPNAPSQIKAPAKPKKRF